MNDLFDKQKILQKQAYDVINALGLEKLLGQYGQFKLVGSIVYGLMTWRDIDMDLRLASDPTDTEYWKIVQEIFKKTGVKLVTLADNRLQTELDRPRSMYIGIKYEDADKNSWKIDIRLLGKEFVKTDEVEELVKKATIEQKQAILFIKSQVHNDPKYHKDFSSLDIYQAVINNKISTLIQFQDYLKHKTR
jgi:hypothetical protein